MKPVLDARRPHGVAAPRIGMLGLSGFLLVGAVLTAPASAVPAPHSITATIPVGTSPTAVEPCHGEMYVANHGDSTVSVIDPTTLAVVGSPIAVGSNPYGIACDGDFVYTANYGSNDVSVIDTRTHSVVASSIPAGPGASDVVVADGYAYVSNQSNGTVSVIDTTSRASVDTLSVGGYPCGLAVLGAKVYVSNLHAGAGTSVIDTTSRTVVDTIPMAHAVRSMAAVSGSLYFPTEGASKLIRVDATNPAVTAELALSGAPTSIAIADGIAYVTSFGADSVYVVDLDTFTVIDTVSMTLYPSGIATYGDNAYVALQGSGAVKTFSIAPPTPTVPDAPTAVHATAGNAQAAVSFNAPASDGHSAITSYEVTAHPGGVTAVGASSPLIINGLTNSTSYTFTVKAINAIGSSSPSGASNPVTPSGPDSSGGSAGGASIPGGLDSLPTSGSTLPPPPETIHIIRGPQGSSSTVQVHLAAASAGTVVRSAVVVVLDSQGTVVTRISLSVRQGQTDIDFQVPYLADGYSVLVYNANELGVSSGAVARASTVHASTITMRDSQGKPTLFGSLVETPIRFSPRSAVLDAADRKQLRRIAQTVKARGQRLFITGFAVRGSGTDREPAGISTARAQAVADFLSARGVRVWMRYWGAGSLKGRGVANDRRVEIRASAQPVPRRLVA